MEQNKLKPRKALNKAYLKMKTSRADMELFKKNLIQLTDNINELELEEFHKNLVSDFLKNTFYGTTHFINTKNRKDLVIHNGSSASSTVGVILEAKKPTSKAEMIRVDKLNAKALQELLYYYMQERITHKNLEIKHLVATNIYEWFIFDAHIFEKRFAENKAFVKKFIDFEEKRAGGLKTEFFYTEIAAPAIEIVQDEIIFTHFDIRDYNKELRDTDKQNDAKLIALYKLLSPEHLLKLPFANDSNSLDKIFYSELLHIIGLEEVKDGSKKLIQRKKAGSRNAGSLLESAIVQLDSLDKLSRLEKPSQFGNNNEERLFNVGLELCITWINRILFLKLLEAQLLKYHKNNLSYAFLNTDKVKNLDDLNTLFFSVLAKMPQDRNDEIKTLFARVPYLNSSLFEPTDIEHSCLFISQLKDGMLPLLSGTVIKDNTGKKRCGTLSIIDYIFDFLNAYDFSSEGSEEIQEDNKRLINASVLGLIFEKINGYKDGSFFTPGFITMYMCRETIRRAVMQKFNDAKGWQCAEFGELYDKIDDRTEANGIINSLKICDPAVGSGHFLVSALNEMIAIKSELRILSDREGKRLKEYNVQVENDELVVIDDDGLLFDYNPNSRESQRVQETLFHEKQTIIENCLFGVDINPNSVKICRLRLWIELLKNAYYRIGHDLSLPRELETLPNIDINIKCGNSLISRYALDADIKKALKGSKWTIGNYRDAVKTYRNTKSKEVKREMEKLILSIKQDFTSEIRRNDPLKTRLDKLSHDLYNRFTGNFMFEPEQEYGKNSKLEKKKKDEQKKLEDEINAISHKMNEIRDNIIFENSFEWRFEFPEVLSDEGDFIGFDVVIGNPPYGVKLGVAEINVLTNNFPSWESNILSDSYFCFITLAMFISSKRSLLSYIIPNTWRLIGIASDFRKNSLLKYGLSTIDTFLKPVFDEAVVDCDIVFYNKLNDKDSIKLRINDNEKLVKTNSILVSTLANMISINSYLGENEYRLIEKIRYNSTPLNEIVTIKNGVKPYEVGKGNPKQTKEILIEKPFTKTFKVDESFVPLIGGSLFQKYHLKWNNDYYISYGPWLAAPRDISIFEATEKIIVRQTSDKLIATIVEKGFIMRDNTHILLSLDSNYRLKFILALVNSKLFDFIYWTINPEKGEALAQVKTMHLDQLPIKYADNDRQNLIISFVEDIMKLKQINADTTALESEIDRLVYELYGLSEEEIRIVEGEKI